MKTINLNNFLLKSDFICHKIQLGKLWFRVSDDSSSFHRRDKKVLIYTYLYKEIKKRMLFCGQYRKSG